MSYQRAKAHFKASILVVDDNALNLQVAKLLLESLGCQVDTAIESQIAINMTKNTIYDLIFMDLSMPEKDGFQTAMEIRKNEAALGHSPKIIAFSANINSKTIVQQCLKNGMNDCVAKPLTQEMLENRLESWGARKIFNTT